jgi:hypothetical protein
MTKLLANEIVKLGLLDWVALRDVVGIFELLFPNRAYLDSTEEIVHTLAWLCEDGQVEVGTVTAKDGFLPWEIKTDVSQALTSLFQSATAETETDWGYQVWFSNLDRGNVVGRSLKN